MGQSNAASCRYAQIVGTFLASAGIWGLSAPVIFGELTTNITQAFIHIVLGGAGIWLGIRRKARAYCCLIGIVLPALGALSFLPSTQALLVRLLNVNAADARFDIVLGALSLFMAFAADLRLQDGALRAR